MCASHASLYAQRLGGVCITCQLIRTADSSYWSKGTDRPGEVGVSDIRCTHKLVCDACYELICDGTAEARSASAAEQLQIESVLTRAAVDAAAAALEAQGIALSLYLKHNMEVNVWAQGVALLRFHNLTLDTLKLSVPVLTLTGAVEATAIQSWLQLYHVCRLLREPPSGGLQDTVGWLRLLQQRADELRQDRGASRDPMCTRGVTND